MAENLTNILKQLRTFWKGMPGSSRWLFLGISSAILFIGIVFSVLSFRPHYATLFSKLTSEDAGQVVKKLKEQNVPYQIGRDGKSVAVPRDRVRELRLSLATEGLPQGGGVGFELFDKPNWNITEFTQKINYLRALQTELQRTINQLKPVETSRVHIVLPEKRLFEEDQEEATASVVLNLKSYTHLRQNQIKGIMHLVSRSVEGLKIENVEVIDTDGNVLSDEIREGNTLPELTEAQMRARRSYEKVLEKRIESMLRKVLGKNRVVARVNAELDFAQSNVKSETYKPVVGEEGIVRSEQNTEESFKGKGVAPGGPPGVTSNVPTYPASPTGQSEYKKADKIKNYEVSKIVEQKVNAPGVVKRLSVAVIVDKKALKKIQVKDIKGVASAAAGINTVRGDRIEVVSMLFSREQEAKEKSEMAKERMKILIFWGVGVVISILMVLLFYLMMRPRKKELEEFAPKEVIPVRTLEEKQLAEEMGVPLLEKGEETEEEKERKRKKSVYEEIVETVEKRPQDVAQLVRGWIGEE